MGSSPRGRGKHATRDDAYTAAGLIPAWAGKTRRHARRARRKPAHPRVGGENSPTPPPTAHAAGSSPRGRGKLAALSDEQASTRLIPAWAGKTTWPPAWIGASWAHPRVGGENNVRFHVNAIDTGSSPRGRGKRKCHERPRRSQRLIPAWAGKTSAIHPATRACPAHPRVGGENTWDKDKAVKAGGSSPRGRGKPCRSPMRPRSWGLIPAWAGKTTGKGTCLSR